MTKKPLTSVIVAVGVVSMALAGSASARSVSALTGSARRGVDVECYNANFSNGTVDHVAVDVLNGCRIFVAEFKVPLTTDPNPLIAVTSKAITFTSRNAARTGGTCCAVAADRFGNSVSASPFLSIPMSATYVSQTTGPVSVPRFGTFFAACSTVLGDSLAEFDYNPF